ncbi:Lmf1, partial [Symbiodinium sp. KB8]
MAAVVLRYWSAIVAPLNGYMEELATEEARHVIYGLLLRFIGLGYIVCFAAFIPQVLPIAGSRGYNPLAPQLKKLKKIYRSKAYWWFPSLFWLNASDFMLKFLPILGCLGGLGIIIGGPWTPWLFLMCWLITLSMDMAVDMIYPWDSFLLEFGFLCIWAPGLNMLPRATVRAMPTPLLSFAFRYVLFRLMLGFGKLKFTGTNQEDRLYIKHFFVYQPMASIIGWFANKLPNAFHVASLYIMFFVEVPLPFFVFFCGLPRLIAAFGFWGLQFGIQLGGNFGYFNLLYALASTVLLDHSASVWDISWATTFGGDWSDALFTLIYVYICAVSLLYFAFNSWCNLAWMYWPTLDKSPKFFQGLLTVIRLMQPLRLVQSYGVFPPNSAPGIRYVYACGCT